MGVPSAMALDIARRASRSSGSEAESGRPMTSMARRIASGQRRMRSGERAGVAPKMSSM